MNQFKRLYYSVGLFLIGIGIVLLGASDMQQAAAARPNAWFAATTLDEPLAGTLVQCPDDRDSFYMVSGIVTGNINTNQLTRYDITEATWVSRQPMPAPLRAVAAACYQGKLFVAGGRYQYGTISNSFYIYDITEDAWTAGPQLPDVVWGAAMGAWDGKLYLVGGTQIGVPYTPNEGRVDVFDLASWEWTADAGQRMPTAASFFSSVQIGPYLYAVGGASGDFTHNVDQTQRYDMSAGALGQWDVGPTFTNARGIGNLAVTNSHLYMLGGDLNGGGAFDSTNLVDVLDLSTWPNGSWADLDDPLPALNLYPASTCSEELAGGEIWAVGGLDGEFNVYNTNYYRPTEPCADFYFGDLPREEWELGNHPGDAAHYVLPVVNNGTTDDTYDVTIASSWVFTAPATIGPIVPGMTDLLMIDIEVPADADPDDFDIATVTIISRGDASVFDTAVLTTSVTNWHEAASVPEDMAFHQRAQCANDPNRFFVLGGGTPDLWSLTEVYSYTAISDTWTHVTNLPRSGGWGHLATCYDNKLYVLGSGFSQYLDVYDLATQLWDYGVTYAPRDPYAAGIGVWDDQLFMVGGTEEVNIYNITENTWRLGPPMPAMPTIPFAFGYIQAGQYLYVVGGFTGDWIDSNDNMAITLRLDLANEIWESGPSFSSRRAIVDLGVSESHLYAIAGDVNGGERLDPVGLVEVLDISQWPAGEWVDIEQPLPWALEANWGGFCTEARSGGEVWSVGGASGTWAKFITINDTYYLPTGEPCIQNIVNVPDQPMYGEGKAGATLNYTFTITNTGNITDYYHLTSSSVWSDNLVMDELGPIGPGDALEVVVGITVPSDAPPETVGHSIVLVESLRDPHVMDELQIYTTVLPTYIVDLAPDNLELRGMRGEQLEYVLTVTNEGNITDTISLTYTGNTWDVYLPVMEYTLGVGESAEVIVYVTIPSDAWLGDSHTVTLVATSAGDPLVMDSVTLTTTAFWYQILLPISMKN